MLANALSMLRVALTPVLIWSLHRDGTEGGFSLLSAATLLTAIATDFLDGIAARRLGQITRLGKILDPLADKIAIGGVAVALVLWRDFPLWLVLLQLARDLTIVGGGALLVRSRDVVISASQAGKLATLCMAFAFCSYVFEADALIKGGAVYATAVLLLVSSVGYGRTLIRVLRGIS